MKVRKEEREEKEVWEFGTIGEHTPKGPKTKIRKPENPRSNCAQSL
jgi:hypothetical protein